ncbi:MAG TPA: phosphate ABC transporter permease PstA, partial [Chitinispirillaceae bacterium]|nr:phosphate ABC transporter permease PstA [Chitinispirillaceae bacterium]
IYKPFLRVAIPGISGLAVLTIVATVFGLVLLIAINGLPGISWKFLTEAPSDGMTGGGIFPAIVGTFFLVLLMSIIGVPIGTITALFLSEYVEKDSWIVKTIRFAVNTLAGIPSIVFGLFGLGFFVQFVGSGMDQLAGGQTVRWGQPNILWASITMAVLTLPVVIVAVEEAIRTVPRDLRDASLALGATKWETIVKVVLPGCSTGILTGTILAISRGAGEVAPILFTGAAYFLPELPNSLTDQFMNLGYHVYIMATQSPDVDATKGIQYSTTLVLLAMTFAFNLLAIIFRYRVRKKRIA